MARKRKQTQSSVEQPHSRRKLPNGITLEQRLHGPEEFNSLAWSPDGQSLVALTLNQAIFLSVFGDFLAKQRELPGFSGFNRYVYKCLSTRRRRISSETKHSKTTGGSQAKDSETLGASKQG